MPAMDASLPRSANDPPARAKQAARPEHALYAFDVLHAHLSNKAAPSAPDFNDEDGKELRYPLFVTWNIRSSSSSRYKLRGCIGNFHPLPLPAGLAQYALTA
jgi:AMMECR1 domain-containing protein